MARRNMTRTPRNKVESGKQGQGRSGRSTRETVRRTNQRGARLHPDHRN